MFVSLQETHCLHFENPVHNSKKEKSADIQLYIKSLGNLNIHKFKKVDI